MKWKEKLPQLFETDKAPERLHIGLRIIKTSLAVFLCAVFGYWRGQMAFFSMIAAIICMQPTTEQTIVFAFNRSIGTLIGGAFGLAAIYIGDITGIIKNELLFLLLVSLLIIPVILINLIIRKPASAAFSCIVLIAIAVTSDPAPFHAAYHRLIDTIIGILVALFINIVLPRRKVKDMPQQAPDDQREGF